MPKFTLEPPPIAVEGPSVWTGAEMLAQPSWVVPWVPEQLAEMRAAALHFQALNLPLEQISPDNFPLTQLKPFLASLLAELLHGRGFVLLRGIPVQELGIELAAIIYMGLGVHLGTLRSSNGKGHLLGHVCDQGVDITKTGGRFYQTNKKLDFHTDSADFVGLLCLQKAKAGGESFIASSMKLYNEIVRRRPDLVEALFMPYATDRRGEVPEGLHPWFDMPIFTWYENHLSCVYIRQYIEAAQDNFPEAKRLTTEQLAVMDLIDEILAEPGFVLPMAFEPGDMQLLHNHQILHSRNDFENWPERERQRHLLRLWMAPKEGRPLPDYFKARWGSTQAGERGGIIVPGAKLSVELDYQ